MKLYYKIFLIVTAVVFWSGCKKSDKEPVNVPVFKSTLSISLTDAPAAYSAVKVNITGIDYNLSSDSLTSAGWIPLTLATTGTIDLLTLQNGGSVNVVNSSIDTASIKQFRLHFNASGNSVTNNGTNYPLIIPDIILQKGAVVKASYIANANTTLSVWIDFDAAASVHHDSVANTYTLFPVLRTFDPSASGSIEGYVTPPASQASVIVQNETNVPVNFSTRVFPDYTLAGRFKVTGLAPGNYLVIAAPVAPGFKPKVLRNITVRKNETTSVGNILVEQTSFQSSSLFNGQWKVYEYVDRNIGGFVGRDTFFAKTIIKNDSTFGIVQTERTPDPDWVLSYPYANADTLWFIPLQTNRVLKNTYQGDIGFYSVTGDTLQFTYTFGAPGNYFVYLVSQQWIRQ